MSLFSNDKTKVEVTVKNEPQSGCLDGVVVAVIAIAILIAAIGAAATAIATAMMELIGFLLEIVILIVGIVVSIAVGIILILLSIPFGYAMYFYVRDWVFAFRDAIMFNSRNRSPSAGGFANFLRSFFGFIKDLLLFYFKYNGIAVKERFIVLADSGRGLAKKAFFFLTMVDLAFVAFVLPFLIPIILLIFVPHVIINVALPIITALF